MLDVDRHRSDRPIQEGFPRLGYNYRLTNLQAALGRVQMGRLDEIVRRRRRARRPLHAAFSRVDGIEPPLVPVHVETNYQSYMVRIGDRPHAAATRS